MSFFGFHNSKDSNIKKDGGLNAFGQGIGLKYNGFDDVDKLECGYIFDTNKDFVINNKSISSYLSGNSYAINIKFKRSSIGTKQALFSSSDNSLAVYLTATNEIQLSHYNTTEKTATTTSVFTDISGYYYLSVVFNTTTPSSSKIFVNGVDEALSSNTLTSIIDPTVNDYYLASNGSSFYFEGVISQFSINSDVESLSEHIVWNENLLLPNDIFSNIIKLLNVNSDPLYDRVNGTFAALDTVNPAISNKAIMIDNPTDGLTIDDNTTMNNLFSSAVTFNIVIKCNSDSIIDGLIFAKWDAGNQSFAINTYNDRYRLVSQNKSTWAFGGLVAGEDAFLSIVMNGTDNRIYINGVDATTLNNITALPIIGSESYAIGKGVGSDLSPNALLSSIQVVNKAITPSEAAEIWNNGKPLDVADTSFSGNLGFEFKAEDLSYDGQRFRSTDLVSGQEVYSRFVSMVESDLEYYGIDVATSRNLIEFDKECNGVVSKGETIDLIFTSGQSNDYGAEPLTSLPSDYDGLRNCLKRWNGSAFVNVDLLGSISNPLAVTGTYAYQPSLINKFQENSGRDLFLHSYSVSATRLGEDTGNDWNTNSIGEYFDLSETERADGDALLEKNDVNIVAEIWNQHEADCANLTWANAYETNLKNYINKRRLTYPNLKFVIVLVHSDLPIGLYPYKATVKAAQLSVASSLLNVVTINQDSFSSQVDNIHRDASGYEDLGDAIYNEIKLN